MRLPLPARAPSTTLHRPPPPSTALHRPPPPSTALHHPPHWPPRHSQAVSARAQPLCFRVLDVDRDTAVAILLAHTSTGTRRCSDRVLLTVADSVVICSRRNVGLDECLFRAAVERCRAPPTPATAGHHPLTISSRFRRALARGAINLWANQWATQSAQVATASVSPSCHGYCLKELHRHCEHLHQRPLPRLLQLQPQGLVSTPATGDTLAGASAFLGKIARADVRCAVREFDMPDLKVLDELEARCFVHHQKDHSVLVWTELLATTEQGKPPIVFVDQVGIARDFRQRYTHASGYDYGVLGLLLAALRRRDLQVFASPPPNRAAASSPPRRNPHRSNTRTSGLIRRRGCISFAPDPLPGSTACTASGKQTRTSWPLCARLGCRSIRVKARSLWSWRQRCELCQARHLVDSRASLVDRPRHLVDRRVSCVQWSRLLPRFLASSSTRRRGTGLG